VVRWEGMQRAEGCSKMLQFLRKVVYSWRWKSFETRQVTSSMPLSVVASPSDETRKLEIEDRVVVAEPGAPDNRFDIWCWVKIVPFAEVGRQDVQGMEIRELRLD